MKWVNVVVITLEISALSCGEERERGGDRISSFVDKAKSRQESIANKHVLTIFGNLRVVLLFWSTFLALGPIQATFTFSFRQLKQ